MFKLSSDEFNYILENTNPNEKKAPFTIEKKEMQFDTNKFYEYVFADINQTMEIEITNGVLDENDKSAQRIYSTIDEICKGIINKMNEKCFNL